MAEYIEREAAINAVYEAYADGESAYDALIALPAADVREVTRGRWKHWYSTLNNDYSRCTCCQKDVDGFANYSYCPNCGADMREEN